MWRGGREMSIEIKTPEQIAVMREAGLVVARTLRVLAAAVRPGVTTAELDAIAEAEIRGAGATPYVRLNKECANNTRGKLITDAYPIRCFSHYSSPFDKYLTLQIPPRTSVAS